MKIAIVSGSHRPNSESGKVARHIQQVLSTGFEGTTTCLLDLGREPLPLWDEEVRTGAGKGFESWRPVSKQLQECDALVVVSPEWGGMVPAALKNFFLFCEGGELAHKPGLIVAVASRRGGAYPIAELRMSSYKNTFVCYLPEHIIIREVDGLLNGDTPVSQEDGYIRQRLKSGLALLLEYARALRGIRGSCGAHFEKYPYGM